jgi:hypothetical protein
VIDTNHPLSNRYRYLITDAVPDNQWLSEQWNGWCNADSSKDHSVRD